MFLPVALKHKKVDFRGCQSHGDRPIDGIQETPWLWTVVPSLAAGEAVGRPRPAV